MELILWRHAQAEDLPPNGRDLSRALTSKGRKQATAMATWLNTRLPPSTLILCSPARRTTQTADALKRPYEITEDLNPESPASRLLQVAGWPQSALTAVLLVGHQPALGQCAAIALTGKPLPWGIKKGALWWLSCEPSDTNHTATTLKACLHPGLL